jgi:hypothetical protein
LVVLEPCGNSLVVVGVVVVGELKGLSTGEVFG